jgi:glyoxylase-like metal-dependent hydrolase (beta-lactamase superfamily II)
MHMRKVLDRIEKLELESPIEKIVLTHRHFDHVGGAADLASKFNAEVLIHVDDADCVEGGDNASTAADAFGAKLKPIKVTRVAEDDVISTGDNELTVLHTPGHTTGSICLYERRKRFLIAGDTVFVGGVGRWDLPTGNRRELKNSIRTLLMLQPQDMYPGHGPTAIGNATEAIQDAYHIFSEVPKSPNVSGEL